LDRLADARVPHVAVVDQPTTGGVWVAIGARADVRIGISGATVGFSGPRVIEAMTGVSIGPGANTAETAGAAALLDAVVAESDALDRVGQIVALLQADEPTATTPPAPVGVPDRSGWEQVEASREAGRLDGVELLDAMLPDSVALAGRDDNGALRLGRLAGRRVVAMALTSRRGRLAAVAAYEQLLRAAGLADRLGAGPGVLI